MKSLEEHYSVSDIETRILDALRTAGLNTEQRLSPQQLAALDHFHTGGFPSSLRLQEMANVQADDRVLDLGAGLAGPARMLAASPGCRVDCVDLSPDYCVGAKLLNRLTGLEDKVSVHVGSALDLPFPDDSFDVVWMQNVGMNIENKKQFYSEINRVLKSGGRFAFQEMAAGDAAISKFPLPWATESSDNFLISADEMHSILGELGFDVEVFEDASHTQLGSTPSSSTSNTASIAPPVAAQAQLSLSTYVDDLGLKAENAQRSLQDGE
ncbi:MAG: methyltransferase domain-containing protein, partial [Gammaproteobacteria bacterium]|nr:methyltransferase domain-containing protein [Gammaproteobacteria bacterium]